MAVYLMDGICRPQLHSHNRIINLKAIDNLAARYGRKPKIERMSPNPTPHARTMHGLRRGSATPRRTAAGRHADLVAKVLSDALNEAVKGS
jgi:hypothetical protein